MRIFQYLMNKIQFEKGVSFMSFGQEQNTNTNYKKIANFRPHIASQWGGEVLQISPEWTNWKISQLFLTQNQN